VSRPKRKPEGDYLLAYCWCGRAATYVEGHHIRDGKTWQCSKACWTYYKARGPKFPDTPFAAQSQTSSSSNSSRPQVGPE